MNPAAGGAPSLLRLCLATAPFLAMTGRKTFYEFISVPLIEFCFFDSNKSFGGKIMEYSGLLVEKDKREKRTLEKHARLSRLYKEDRFAFEQERKRLIDEVISSAGDEKLRDRLRSFQESWDRKMKGAGSGHNRLVLAQRFFWEHFHETWQPNIQKLNAIIKGGWGEERS
jgi:hypothetical protein